MSTVGGPVFAFSLPGGAARPLSPRQVRHCLAYCAFDKNPIYSIADFSVRV